MTVFVLMLNFVGPGATPFIGGVYAEKELAEKVLGKMVNINPKTTGYILEHTVETRINS